MRLQKIVWEFLIECCRNMSYNPPCNHKNNIWIVQAHGIHLERLRYLKDREFEFLEKLKKRFLRRIQKFFDKKESKVSLVVEKKPKSIYVLKPVRSTYEVSNMVNTRDSLLWSWLRVKEYMRNMKEWHGL